MNWKLSLVINNNQIISAFKFVDGGVACFHEIPQGFFQVFETDHIFAHIAFSINWFDKSNFLVL